MTNVSQRHATRQDKNLNEVQRASKQISPIEAIKTSGKIRTMSNLNVQLLQTEARPLYNARSSSAHSKDMYTKNGLKPKSV